jgi:hypothetical protein
MVVLLLLVLLLLLLLLLLVRMRRQCASVGRQVPSPPSFPKPVVRLRNSSMAIKTRVHLRSDDVAASHAACRLRQWLYTFPLMDGSINARPANARRREERCAMASFRNHSISFSRVCGRLVDTIVDWTTSTNSIKKPCEWLCSYSPFFVAHTAPTIHQIRMYSTQP